MSFVLLGTSASRRVPDAVTSLSRGPPRHKSDSRSPHPARRDCLASPTVEIRLTTAGRAAARAGLGVTAPARTPKGLLSPGLYRQLLDVAAAEPDGLEHLRGENHLHLGTDYTFRGHPSRGYLDYPTTASGQGRWHLTDTGRRQLTEHRDTYQQLYTDPTEPTAPASDRVSG